MGEFWCDLYRLSNLVKISFIYDAQILGRAERWHNAQEKLRTMIRDISAAQQAVEWSRNNPRLESRLAENEKRLEVVSGAFEKKKKYFYSISKTFASSLIEEDLLDEENLPEFLQRPLAKERKRREAANLRAEREAHEEILRLMRRKSPEPRKRTMWTLHELKAMWESGDIPEEARGLITFTKEKPRDVRKSASKIKKEGGDGGADTTQPTTDTDLEAAAAELYPQSAPAGHRAIDHDASPWVFMAPGLREWDLPGTSLS
ncbi:uncharacterized protein ColSpa_02950 [Colletotrichum spaethianum]|uniref:Uncharacterized protein n=1 Tax=Colletotrichum spaethianum TaxID=700344 RepID=A0AA37P797_9PEZI|nr:uncharacterized protein ColSpa_02950 [Colletotrichum spaethianum]GKT42769.1 hypothetical protein ColSpa_02950 [Colletotrichum spaethianum]